MCSQLEALRKGLGDLVPQDVRDRIGRIVSPAEFGLLVCGFEVLDVTEWKAHSVRHQGLAIEIWDRFFWKVGFLFFA